MNLYALYGFFAKKCPVKTGISGLRLNLYLILSLNFLLFFSCDYFPRQPKHLDKFDPVRPEMVLIEGGEFTMGSKEGQKYEKAHKVSVSSFYLGKYEVTVGEFKRFVLKTGYKTSADKTGWSNVYNGKAVKRMGGANFEFDEHGVQRLPSEYHYPVIHVSWEDAVAYCKWLSKATGADYHLPTEAQWEYAASLRGQVSTFPWGDELPPNQRVANFSDKSAKAAWECAWAEADYDDGYAYIAPADSFPPNALGLYNMQGNVWEYCADWYDRAYYQEGRERNPHNVKQKLKDGTTRVVRGGSWYEGLDAMRVSHRNRRLPSKSSNIVGFRLARRKGTI